MATAQDLRDLEAAAPWLRGDFQAGLATLRESTADASRRFAADMQVLARLAAQVPRCPFDETGATPWTSFRREVAVARTLSDRAAAAEIRAAVALTTHLPRTLSLLCDGRITVPRARAFLDELQSYDDEITRRIDDDLAERAAALPQWRIAQEVRRAAAVLDPEAAAQRTADKNAGRGVSLTPDADDQACATIYGPAVALTRWYSTLDERARALKQAGDARPLDALRFDLATSTSPCATHAPADPATAEAGLRPSFVEPASTDCRMSRPVQANVTVPVETSLGLSNEPGWLDGYGWISAPTCRLLLVDAELRRVCVQSGTGQLVDLAARDVRPPPTPSGVREAVLEMIRDDIEINPIAWRREDQHDPSPPLRELVELRDRFCDGPTGSRVSASRSDLDHEIRYLAGPTAAWNLVARAQRTHQLKHFGWTPLRTATATLWFSPAGQLVEVPHHRQGPPGIDADPDEVAPRLPDADELAAVDQQQLEPRRDEQGPPALPDAERLPRTEWSWLIAG